VYAVALVVVVVENKLIWLRRMGRVRLMLRLMLRLQPEASTLCFLPRRSYQQINIFEQSTDSIRSRHSNTFQNAVLQVRTLF
jgi:hypothetical protein